jgi:hypothetical protein
MGQLATCLCCAVLYLAAPLEDQDAAVNQDVAHATRPARAVPSAWWKVRWEPKTKDALLIRGIIQASHLHCLSRANLFTLVDTRGTPARIARRPWREPLRSSLLLQATDIIYYLFVVSFPAIGWVLILISFPALIFSK